MIPKAIQDLLNFIKNPLFSGTITKVINTIYDAGLEIEPSGRVKANIGGYKLTVTKENAIITLSIEKIDSN